MRRLLIEKEVAKLMRVEPQTLRKKRIQGKGPPWMNVEGAIRYDPDVVRAWLAEHTVQPAKGVELESPT